MQTFTIHGRTIETDKTLAGVEGTRVSFTDGSWCDTRSGDVHLARGGTIRLGEEASASGTKERVASVRRTFENVAALVVGGFSIARLRVEAVLEPGSAVEVEATGDARILEGLRLVGRKGALRMEVAPLPIAALQHSLRQEPAGGWGWLKRLFGAGRAAVESLEMVSQGAEVRVRCPRGTDVRLEGGPLSGAEMTGALGTLEGSIDGVGEVRVEELGGLAIELSGTGSLQVSRLRGSARLEVESVGGVGIGRVELESLHLRHSGVGTFSVREGRIGELDIRHSGVGGVEIEAEVESASVEAEGVGGISVPRVAQVRKMRREGIGSVRLGDVR